MTRTSYAPLFLSLSVALGGCASNPPTGPVYDPLENTNRKLYAFNDALDRAVLKPVAKGYRYVLPDPVEDGIDNFFNNLAEPGVVVNDVLQGKLAQAASDTGRFLVNTTVGVLGLFDVGTRVGLPRHIESLNQTLGVWGVGEGPFLMVPLLGPNNARSTAGFAVETQTTSLPPYLTDEAGVVYGLAALDVVSTRARLLSAGNLLDSAALDPYLLLRDFWVRQQRELVWDGERDVAIGAPDYGDGDDGSDGGDGLDELDRLDDEDGPDAPPADELDELDRLEALDAAGPAKSAPVEKALDEIEAPGRPPAPDTPDAPDELDEIDRLDE